MTSEKSYKAKKVLKQCMCCNRKFKGVSDLLVEPTKGKLPKGVCPRCQRAYSDNADKYVYGGMVSTNI